MPSPGFRSRRGHVASALGGPRRDAGDRQQHIHLVRPRIRPARIQPLTGAQGRRVSPRDRPSASGHPRWGSSTRADVPVPSASSEPSPPRRSFLDGEGSMTDLPAINWYSRPASVALAAIRHDPTRSCSTSAAVIVWLARRPPEAGPLAAKVQRVARSPARLSQHHHRPGSPAGGIHARIGTWHRGWLNEERPMVTR